VILAGPNQTTGPELQQITTSTPETKRQRSQSPVATGILPTRSGLFQEEQPEEEEIEAGECRVVLAVHLSSTAGRSASSLPIFDDHPARNRSYCRFRNRAMSPQLARTQRVG
jgi:hypothetical protein